MRVLPILFNTEMVRAILDGRKTVTRRVVKPQPEMHMFGDREALAWIPPAIIKGYLAVGVQYTEYLKRPYNVGDILYVRETWGYDKNVWLYKADFSDEDLKKIACITKWHPSIHMPREAARIWLRVTDVRVERLQEITDDDIQREGVHGDPYTFAASEFYDRPELKDNYSKAQFAGLWDSTIKPTDRERYGWAANPWVWVIEFKRCDKPEVFAA